MNFHVHITQPLQPSDIPITFIPHAQRVSMCPLVCAQKLMLGYFKAHCRHHVISPQYQYREIDGTLKPAS